MADRRLTQWLPLLAVILAAAFFRFYQLDTVPVGLYHDELYNAQDALISLGTGEYRVFYESNEGREGLFIVLTAGILHLLGTDYWVIHILPALCGVLTVLGLFLLVRRTHNWQLAAISSFLLASSFWHIVFSRTAFRAIMAPLFMVWLLYFFAKGWEEKRWSDFALAGLMLGLGMYTYIAFRIVPLVLLVLIGLYLGSRYRQAKRRKRAMPPLLKEAVFRGSALTLAIGLLVSAPLWLYFWQHSGTFSGRAASVSVFNFAHPLLTAGLSFIAHFMMLTVYGDRNPRSNLSGDPVLDPLLSVFFLLGVTVALLLAVVGRDHWPRRFQVTYLLYLTLGLIPASLSFFGVPHSLRSLLVAPAVYVFVALGIWYAYCAFWGLMRDQLGRKTAANMQSHQAAKAIFGLLLVGLLSWNALTTHRRYFHDWAADERLRELLPHQTIELQEMDGYLA